MQFVDKFLIFLAILIATVLVLLFSVSLESQSFNVLMAGFSVFAFFLALYEFFRKNKS